MNTKFPPPQPDLLLHIGKQIRRQRIRLQLSQEAFAEKAGFHRTYIGTVERGEQNLSLHNFIKIAHALHVSITELVLGIEAVPATRNGNTNCTPEYCDFMANELPSVDANTFTNEPQPVFIFDMQGKIVHVNPAFAKLMGYNAEDMPGKHITAIHPPECAQEVRANLINIFNGFLAVCRVPLMTNAKRRIMVETKIVRGYWERMQVIIGIAHTEFLSSD